MFPREIKGSVLLIALLMMSVISILSTEILLSSRIEIKQAMEGGINDRIYLDFQGYQYWAILALKEYKEKEMPTPAIFKTDMFEGANISGEWQDQQALFNLNSLKEGDMSAKKGFINLLVKMGKIEEGDALLIVREIETYLKAVDMMVSVSELRMIKRVSQALFLKLQRYLTALPTREHKININTVNSKDPFVLLTLSEKMTIESAKALISCRAGFIKESETEAFLNCVNQKRLPISLGNLVYFSRYFLAVGYVKIQDQQRAFYTLLERVTRPDRPPAVRLLWQSQDAK